MKIENTPEHIDAMAAAYEAGYRSGYLNGWCDTEQGEEHNTSSGDAFEMWLDGDYLDDKRYPAPPRLVEPSGQQRLWPAWVRFWRRT